MSRSHSSLSEHDLQHNGPFFPVLPHLPSRDDNQISPNARTAGLSGRVAMRRQLIGYEPNAIVEISTVVTPIHHASSWASFFLLCVELRRGPRLHPCLRRQMRDKSIGRQASPGKNVSLCWRKFYATLIPLTQTEIEQRHKRRTKNSR